MINVTKDKIVVREFKKEDYSQFIMQLCNNPKWTNVFQMWDVKGVNAEKLFLHHFEQYRSLDIKTNGLMFGIFTENNLLVGECGFEYNAETMGVEIFLGLIEQARGKGYGISIVEALIEISRDLGINVIHANVPEAHDVVIKIMDKSEFKMNNTYDLEFNNLTVKMRHYILK